MVTSYLIREVTKSKQNITEDSGETKGPATLLVRISHGTAMLGNDWWWLSVIKVDVS